MQIQKININEIKPYPNNAKLHPEEHIAQIMASILEFGNNDPIAIDENNVIVEGHGRLEALKKIGYEEIEIIRLSHLTEEQKKAYIIAHNKLTMNTDFDLEKLNKELQSLSEDFQDLTGFTDEEISEIFDSMNTTDKEVVAPELSEPVSKLGDIWVLDKHKVLCGSSTEEEAYKKLLNGELVDLVLTDPPYNIDYGNNSLEVMEQLNHRKDGLTIKNDNMDDEQFKKFLLDFYKNIESNMKVGAPYYIFHSSIKADTFINELKKTSLKPRQILIWVKDRIVFSRQDYHWKHEHILYGWKEGAAHYFTFDRTQDTVIDDYKAKDLKKKTKKELLQLLEQLRSEEPFENDVLYYKKPSKSDLHPTIKPINLLKRLMRNSSLKDDLVFDGFLGSGSTLLAAEQLKRKCYGIELDEQYVDVIVKRYINYKEEVNEPYDIKLIRDEKEIKLEDTGLLDEE
jgi:DNA modification methylase